MLALTSSYEIAWSAEPAAAPSRSGVARRKIRLGMKKEQLARQLAKESRISTAAAADQLDRIMNDILRRVRKGESASLPGLGTFESGREIDFQFDRVLGLGLDRGQQKKGSR